jgi:hypothetical protein
MVMVAIFGENRVSLKFCLVKMKCRTFARDWTRECDFSSPSLNYVRTYPVPAGTVAVRIIRHGSIC